jgi:hypothetical protein
MTGSGSIEDVGGMKGVADDLLQLEFHTDYVGNPEKRRRRRKLRWEALLVLGGLTPLFGLLIPHHHHSSTFSIARLMPPSCCSLHPLTGPHSVASRTVCRDNSLHESTDMVGIRSAFCRTCRTPTRLVLVITTRTTLAGLFILAQWISLEQ